MLTVEKLDNTEKYKKNNKHFDIFAYFLPVSATCECFHIVLFILNIICLGFFLSLHVIKNCQLLIA